jgi:hypothetical protein
MMSFGGRKTMTKFIVYILLNSLYSVGLVHAEEQYWVKGDLIVVSENGGLRECRLSQPPESADVSFDKSAVIVSPRGYVTTQALEQCSSDVTLRISKIPDHVGTLSDINIKNRIYVALDLSSVRPLSWLAVVARIGSVKNMVTLPGAYIPGRSRSILKRQAFTSTGDERMAIISPDGKYVSPSGAMSCDQHAYPGVWDIQKNRRVITDDASCAQLFAAK